ncbi:MAG: ABC transporter permease [Erysipelotrichaceae bacterium]|nr:MAG: ABC transporter [Erysipelotrichaceae bacterium]TXT19076.1 MAG: ABC transporter permease [Erysipelotrichaceae bacterium]
MKNKVVSKKPKKIISHRSREMRTGYAFIMIWVVGFVLFALFPLIQTFNYSLNTVQVTTQGVVLNFVNWSNYQRALFTDPTFIQLLISYFIETIVSVPIILIFSMIIALLLNLKFRFKGFFRTIFFLPVVITSGPVIAELTSQGATKVAGLTDSAAMASFVATLPNYLQAPVQYLMSSFILILWFSGVQILIYLSSLQKIDRSIYEAASIDGASAWESFWKITLPAMHTTTLINAFYTIVTLSHFSESKLITYVYAQTYSVLGGIGFASAMSFIYLIALMLILGIMGFLLSYRGKKQY